MVKVWLVNHGAPGETIPAFPVAFASEEAADAHMDEMMRGEWEAVYPGDQNGEPLPYPGDWRQAHDILIGVDSDGTWGRWEITCHMLDLQADPLRDAAPDMLAVLRDLLTPGRTSAGSIEAGRDLLARLGHDVRAKAEGRADG